MEFCKKYPSGLRVIGKLMPSFFTVSLGVYVDVGSNREEVHQNGFSHFIEHLLFKGTKKRSAAEISEAMDNIGAELNAFTSKDNTCFFTKSSSGDLEKCVELLSDMYFNASFDADELNKERGVVLEEIAMNDDRPEDIAQDLISEALYKGQKIGQTILGLHSNIECSDRHSILEFKNKHYIPQNTVISIAGNFDIDKVDKLVECYFESNFSTQADSTESEEVSKFSGEFNTCFKDVEQLHLCLAFPGESMASAELPKFALMSRILGGGMSSRLFQTIREQNGLAYSVYSYPSAYRNSGNIEIYCGINPQNNRRTVDLLENLLQDFAKNGITENELKRAKAKETNGAYMSFESSLSVMLAYGRRLLKLNDVLDIKKKIADIEAVTLTDVNQIIKKTFSNPFASCYVGREQTDFEAISQIKLC